MSLLEIVDEALADARVAGAHRAGVTLFGGHDHALRQTVIALVAGSMLAEHESPGEATLQVLRGQVRMTAGDESWTGAAGDMVGIPPARHDLTAIEDSAVLLTVVKPR